MTRTEILQTAKPILFNTEMVRAIQGGRKAATRRPIKVNTDFPKALKPVENPVGLMTVGGIIRPQYQVGGYLYVRETWGIYEQSYMDANYILYRADFPNGAKTFGVDGVSCDLPTWRPSIHMPKEATRIFLRVTDIRVERLQAMSHEDAEQEGCWCDEGGLAMPIDKFADVWNSTVKKSDLDKYGWDANPWVWVIEFERVEVT